jgi:hypothetical protein
MWNMMRRFNFTAAQLLRRYGGIITHVAGMDEPGLTDGPNMAGTEMPGFPWWDAKERYELYGWKYTQDPAAGSRDEWMRFIIANVRQMGDCFAQARKDIKTVWPECVYSQDMYVAWDIGEGCDPWNQTAADVPATHCFMDWIGSIQALTSMYAAEKSHDPTAKLNILQNGHCAWGDAAPPEKSIYTYHLLMNQILAAGVQANAWLSYGGVTQKELDVVDEVASRYGPAILAMEHKGPVEDPDAKDQAWAAAGERPGRQRGRSSTSRQQPAEELWRKRLLRPRGPDAGRLLGGYHP